MNERVARDVTAMLDRMIGAARDDAPVEAEQVRAADIRLVNIEPGRSAELACPRYAMIQCESPALYRRIVRRMVEDITRALAGDDDSVGEFWMSTWDDMSRNELRIRVHWLTEQAEEVTA